MPFVVGEDGPDRTTAGPHFGRNLFRFKERNSRVVFSVDNQQRRADFFRMIQRADRFEDRFHLRIAFITIFGSA